MNSYMYMTKNELVYDRPWLRNHLSSVHAIALANLGEFTGACAFLVASQNKKVALGILLD